MHSINNIKNTQKKVSNRSRSNSPANSIDSSFRRRSLSNNKKKLQKNNLKSKEDVQVFTSLPPKVDGDIKCYLRLRIPKISYLTPVQALTDKKLNLQKNQKKNEAPILPNILARCVWWGEEENSNGALFRPKVCDSTTNSNSNNNTKKIQTVAKYMVRSGSRQFSAYLNDMKALDIDLINEQTMESIGKVQLFEIQQLTFNNPIKGYFSAYDSSQTKIGEVFVNIQLESVTQRDDSVESNASKARLSEQSGDENYVTSNSAKNINEFNSKLKIFEQKQQQKHNEANNNAVKNSKFYSETYETHNHFDESFLDKNESFKNPLINTLIERGTRLKNEMLKSSSKNSNNLDELYLSSNKNFNYINNLLDLGENYDYIDESDSNEFLNTEDGIHDHSELVNDPDLLSALIYNNTHPTSTINNTNEFNKIQKLSEYDQELQDLLRPSKFIRDSRLIRSNIANNDSKIVNEKPVKHEPTFKDKFMKSSKLKQDHEKLKSMKSIPKRNQSWDISSNGSACSADEEIDETDLNNSQNRNNIVGSSRRHFGRVSFELQSSDGESYNNASFNDSNEKCIDILSPQRLALLNLIQLATMKIEKLNLFSLNHASDILEKINRIEQQQNQKELLNSINKTTKPPKPSSLIRKNESIGQFFFIEYQFPVIANSREQQQNSLVKSNSLMATQVMRVNASKRFSTVSTDDNVVFENLAEYSVLFNANLLETWWRSAIVFKIYCRSSTFSTATPYLIGIARLELKNVLKSRNFKLYKKLAVFDQLTSGSESKRIGTLHVKIELSSDLKEFNTDLIKLKNYEEKNLKTKSPSKKNIHKTDKQAVSKLNTLISSLSPSLKVKKNPIEEFSLPIQMFLSINEGRGFDSILKKTNQSKTSSNIYLICRLFWNKEKVKFEVENYDDSHFSWTLNLSFLIKPSIIENMRNNFMIIEAWQKNDTITSKDSLIGTIKLSLNEFYLKFSDLVSFKRYISDKSIQALIGVNGWISVCDPFSGKKAGEINVLLAMGSNDQILNLQKILFDRVRLKPHPNKINESPFKKLIEHKFTIKIDNLKLHPVRLNSGNESILDEADCYVKYAFITTKFIENSNELNVNEEVNVNYEFQTYSLSSKMNQTFENKQEHKILLNKTTNLNVDLISKIRNYYKLSDLDPVNILFEVWSRTYYPNFREKLIAKGELAIEKLFSIVTNASISLNNRSFVLPLLLAKNDALPEESGIFLNDKYIGQLFLTIEYSSDEVKFRTKTSLNAIDSSLSFAENGFYNKEHNYACLSVGVLRATGLQVAYGNNSILDEKSSVYIKFSLNFINKPQEAKQTRVIQTYLNGYSPEFFDYFDIKCPLVSTYSSNSKKTVSLAEQLEMGQIIFEIWAKPSCTTNSNTTDVLLGTCIVSLEPLLENRIGIRGWFTIKPFLNNAPSILETILQKNISNAGGLEIAIRFTKNDDFLRIINAGKDIGWIRACDLEFVNRKPNAPLSIKPNNQYHDELKKFNGYNTENSNIRQTIKCLIEIEKAVHLASVYDEKLNKHSPPNSFVTFSISLYNPSEIAQSNVCELQSSPAWNYQLLINVDSEYFIEDGKNFVFKVWHKSLNNNNKLLGYASVDLQPLIYGLTSISGWYNIQDSTGNCQGQLKINILPQESLLPLKQYNENRKKAQNFKSTISKFNFNTTTNPISTSEPINTLNEVLGGSSTLSLSETSSTILSCNTNNIEQIFRQKESKSDLKLGLIKKLNELDELNKYLKERLEKNSPKNVLFKSKNDLLTNEPKELVLTPKASTATTLTTNSDAEVINDDFEQKGELNEPYDTELETPNSNVLLSNPSKTLIEKSESANLDSFWIDPITDDKITEHLVNENENDLHLSSNSSSASVNSILNSSNYQNKNNVEENLSLRIEQINPNLEVEVNEFSVDFNANDTDLDQTFNLNASYEIISINNKKDRESPQNIETSYDIVNKIIDCNKLESDNEEVETNLPTIDNQDNNVFILLETKTTIINDELQTNFDDEDDASNDNNINEENENDDNNNDENLTVIIPEELNKIGNDIENKDLIEINENKLEEPKNLNLKNNNEATERFKQLSAKLPNYFLGEKDLEFSMKQLHSNFKKAAVLDEKVDNKEEEDFKVKPSELLAKNEKLLKQDFDRINKIFHTKFN